MGPHWRAPSYKEISQIFPAIRRARRKGDVPPKYQNVQEVNPGHQSVGGKCDYPRFQTHARRLCPYMDNESYNRRAFRAAGCSS